LYFDHFLFIELYSISKMNPMKEDKFELSANTFYANKTIFINFSNYIKCLLSTSDWNAYQHYNFMIFLTKLLFLFITINAYNIIRNKSINGYKIEIIFHKYIINYVFFIYNISSR